MGEVVAFPVPKPWRRWALAGGGVALLVVASYLAGRVSTPAKTVEKTITVEKTVRDEKAITEAVEHARAEWAKSVQDHTVTRTVTKYGDCGQPVEVEKVVYKDRDSQASGSSESGSSVVAQTETHETTEKRTETVKTVDGYRPGWSLGAGALWNPSNLSRYPSTVSLQLDRRLVGTLWVGAVALADLSGRTGVRVGASARLEW